MEQAGLAVRLDGNPDLMHHKMFIVDSETVITGSPNFSKRGDQDNDENLLIIHDRETFLVPWPLTIFHEIFNFRA
jgi:phosphatidylserine/phosphatidylglycerophosphate/cardiolipin synthase-like enzyme